MDAIFDAHSLQRQMGKNDQSAQLKDGQFDKKPLEFNNEEKNNPVLEQVIRNVIKRRR